jgi:hypothetical protein
VRLPLTMTDLMACWVELIVSLFPA